MSDLISALAAIVGEANVRTAADAGDDYSHDEALNAPWVEPDAVVFPASTAEVAQILTHANEHRIPVTARGAGTGLSGACIPRQGGIVVSFDRMNQVLEIDRDNHAAVVQPGVTLDQLDALLAPLDLVYPVFPGEYSASLGGNVNTNAGGMRAVKYGVTRHHVLGIEAVLPTGEVIRSGGKIVKVSTGYDLTQLVIGSEGTLGLVTEATLKLHPRLPHAATILAPFSTLEGVTTAVPRIIDSGIGPQILEYIDLMTMAAMTASGELDLGVPQDVKDTALAYLVVVLENAHEDRLDADIEQLGTSSATSGRWTCTSCRRVPAPSSSRRGRRRSGWPRHRVPTTSSTSSSREPPSPSSWSVCRSSVPTRAAGSPGAATPATATCTSPCSRPIPTSATR